MKKKTSILDRVCLIMNSCFIQYNAPLVEYVNLAQEIDSFCQNWLVLCQFRINFIIFEVYFVSVTVHDKIQLVFIRLDFHTYFSLTFLFCPF